MTIERLKNCSTYWVFFFLYSGYYSGLSLLFYTGLSSLSKYYSIPLRIVLCLCMFYVIRKEKNNLKTVNNVSTLIFLLFSALYVIKILWTANSGSSLLRSWGQYLFYFLSYCVIPYFFMLFLNVKQYKKVIINATIHSGIVFGLLCLIQFYPYLLTGGIGRLSELSSITGEEIISPLSLSYSGAITILFSIYSLIARSNRISFVNILGIILGIVLLLLGATRGAFVVLIVGLLGILWFSSAKNKFKITGIVLLFIPLLLYLVELTGSSLFKRFENTLETGDNSGRDVLYTASIEEFYRSPIFGGRIEVLNIYPHNFFLEVLMATGILGGILIVTLLFIFMIKIHKALKTDFNYITIFILFISGIIMGQFSNALYTGILIFMSLGYASKSYYNG